MAQIQGADQHFIPRVDHYNQSGQIMSKGLADFGAGLGAGINQYRQEQQNKAAREATAGIMANNPFFQKAMGLPAGTTPQELTKQLSKLPSDAQDQLAQFAVDIAQETERSRNNKVNEGIDQQRADSGTVAANATMKRAVTGQEALDHQKQMSLEEIDARRAQIEINLLNATTSQEELELKREGAQLERQKFAMNGELLDLPRGGKAFWDGNKWERIPNTSDMTPVEKAKALNSVLDPDSSLGAYYRDTRNADGTIKDPKKGGFGFGNVTEINPAFEKTLKDMGYQSYESDNKGELKESSTVIDLGEF